MKPIINIQHLPKDKVFMEAGKFLVSVIELFHNITRKTLILLSGGSSVNALPPLVEFIKTADLDLGFLAFAQVDERFQPDKRQASSVKRLEINKDINAHSIEQTGLWWVCNEKKIPYYIIPQKGSLATATREYNQQMEKLFKTYVYKVAVLGIGGDGHTAGLMPGHQDKWNRARYAVGYELSSKFKRRITLTPKALKEMDYAAVVGGVKKKKAIEKVFNPKNINKINQYPAVILQKIKRVEVFCQ